MPVPNEKNRIKQYKKVTFRNFNPGAAEQWINELNNGITPDNISKKSTKSVYMKCINDPDHIYNLQICRIPLEVPYGCPLCRIHPKIIAGVNDLFTVCEIAKEMWNFNENKNFDEERINPGSDSKASWICNEGHKFVRSISRFVEYPNCPVCKKIKSSVASFPHLTNQWNFEKNKDIDINSIAATSSRTVWWICRKCGYVWQAKISSRKTGKGYCPCCELRTVVLEGVTDLFTLVPEAKNTYDFEKNSAIDHKKLSVTSKESVWWKCDKCGHSWQCAVQNRTSLKNGKYIVRNCPVCIGAKRVISYAEQYPDFKESFVDALNNCALDDLVSSDLNKDFWWHCDICKENFKCSLSSIIRSRNSTSKGCSYCSGKAVLRKNSFAVLHPEVMDEYDPENEVDPFNVTEFSSKVVNWICRNDNSHRWKASFDSRAKGVGGCKICKSYKYKKMFYEEHADFEKYYDVSKNKRPFHSYANSSNEFVWWKCDRGHSFEWAIVNFTYTGEFACPICDNRQLLSGFNDLKTLYPALASEYDTKKNNTTPDNVLITNNLDNTWWKCSKGHEFQRSVWYRINYTRECPICSRRIVIKGINDFQTKYSRIVDIWDFDKNDRNPDEISDRCNDKYYFKCEVGHHYERNLSTVIYNDFECPVCSGRQIQVGVNSLLDTHKELAMELSPNEKRKTSEFHKSYAYNALWRCKVCQGDYLYPIREREVGDNSCPYCNERKVLIGFNSLVDTDFELSKEWSSNNDRKPTEFFKNSAYYALWECPTCKGEYSYSIRDRQLGDDSCPYCNERKALVGFNSLVDTDFELSKEWSKNNDKPPTAYLKSSSYYVLWECPTCHGEYSYSIKDRYVGDNSCPYCNNKKALPGYNTLKVKHPELMKEWYFRNNYLLIDPDSILPTYLGDVWWECPKCREHYKMSPKRRLYFKMRKMESCIFCKGRRRKRHRHF